MLVGLIHRQCERKKVFTCMQLPRIAVLVSGSGTNLQAIIDAVASGQLDAEIAVVVSNRANAFGITRAKNAGIPTIVKTLRAHLAQNSANSRESYDTELAEEILKFRPDIIMLAGFMHILSPAFLDSFPEAVINLHPALPGQFDGTKAIERAWEAFQKGEIPHTGVMIHDVIPQVDRGRVIVKQTVEILPQDTLEDLENRIHAVEHQLVIQGIRIKLQEVQKIS